MKNVKKTLKLGQRQINTYILKNNAEKALFKKNYYL